MVYGVSFAAALAVVCIGYLCLRRRPHRLFVLAYEKIGTPSKKSSLKKEWISARQFEKMVLWLQKHGFTFVSPEMVKNEKKAPTKPVLITFIGGYQSFMNEIFPLVQKYKIPVCLFVPPALIGSYDAWQDPTREPWQNLLTVSDLKILKKSGLVSFGAISLEGEDLTQASKEQSSYLFHESLFRLEKQLGLKAEGFAFWPAKNFDIKKAAQLLPNGFNELILTPEDGLNSQKPQPPFFLKTIRPSCHPWASYCTLWQRR